jgi:hypothetical protein
MILVRHRSKNSCAMGIFPLSRFRKNEWGIIAVGSGSEGLLWYILPAERSFPGRTSFFPPKKPKMSAGRWCPNIK